MSQKNFVVFFPDFLNKTQGDAVMHVNEDCEVGYIKDSGSRSEFASGAVRDCQKGKGRMDLLQIRSMMAVADIMEAGAEKYNARNWEKGIPLSRFLDSGLRHLFKHVLGHTDEPHLKQACWNFLCMLDTELRITEGVLPLSLNDLPGCELSPSIRDNIFLPTEQQMKCAECSEPDCLQRGTGNCL